MVLCQVADVQGAQLVPGMIRGGAKPQSGAQLAGPVGAGPVGARHDEGAQFPVGARHDQGERGHPRGKGAIHGHARGGTLFPQIPSNQPLADSLLHKASAQTRFLQNK